MNFYWPRSRHFFSDRRARTFTPCCSVKRQLKQKRPSSLSGVRDPTRGQYAEAVRAITALNIVETLHQPVFLFGEDVTALELNVDRKLRSALPLFGLPCRKPGNHCSTGKSASLGKGRYRLLLSRSGEAADGPIEPGTMHAARVYFSCSGDVSPSLRYIRRPTSSSSMRSLRIRALPMLSRPMVTAPAAIAPTASAPSPTEINASAPTLTEPAVTAPVADAPVVTTLRFIVTGFLAASSGTRSSKVADDGDAPTFCLFPAIFYRFCSRSRTDRPPEELAGISILQLTWPYLGPAAMARLPLWCRPSANGRYRTPRLGIMVLHPKAP